MPYLAFTAPPVPARPPARKYWPSEEAGDGSALTTAARAVGARQCVQQVVHAREDAGAMSMSVVLLGGVAQSAGDVLAGELANVPG
jgi:hypothetical protein